MLPLYYAMSMLASHCVSFTHGLTQVVCAAILGFEIGVALKTFIDGDFDPEGSKHHFSSQGVRAHCIQEAWRIRGCCFQFDEAVP